jgi:hypothetical protein
MDEFYCGRLGPKPSEHAKSSLIAEAEAVEKSKQVPGVPVYVWNSDGLVVSIATNGKQLAMLDDVPLNINDIWEDDLRQKPILRMKLQNPIMTFTRDSPSVEGNQSGD